MSAAWNKFASKSGAAELPLTRGSYFELTIGVSNLYGGTFLLVPKSEAGSELRKDARSGVPFALHKSKMYINGRVYMLPADPSEDRRKSTAPVYSRTIGLGISTDGYLYMCTHPGPGRELIIHDSRLPDALYPYIVSYVSYFEKINFGDAPFMFEPVTHALPAPRAGTTAITDLPTDVLGRIMTLAVAGSVRKPDLSWHHEKDTDHSAAPFHYNAHLPLMIASFARVSRAFRAAAQSESNEMWRVASEARFHFVTERVPVKDWAGYYRRRMQLALSAERSTGIANCTFEFECPLRIKDLQPTGKMDVYSCDHCHERVFVVRDEAAARKHIDKSHCIAFVPGSPFLSQLKYRPVMGRMSFRG